MSNDLVAMMKNQLAELGGLMDEDTKAIANSSGGGSNKRISIKGGVFRKIVNGKEVGAIEDRHMNIIFVRMLPQPSRMYFDKGYQEGARISPACWSTDSKTPDADVENPISPSCGSCPFAKKGSAVVGAGSACRLHWRTAVVLPNDISGDVMQLLLPPTSCWGEDDGNRKPFKPYIDMLGANNIGASFTVTRMSFDTKAQVPKVMFNPVQLIDRSEHENAIRQSKSAAAEACVKLSVYKPKDKDDDTASVASFDEPVVRSPAKETSSTNESSVEDALKKWGDKRKK